MVFKRGGFRFAVRPRHPIAKPRSFKETFALEQEPGFFTGSQLLRYCEWHCVQDCETVLSAAS